MLMRSRKGDSDLDAVDVVGLLWLMLFRDGCNAGVDDIWLMPSS